MPGKLANLIQAEVQKGLPGTDYQYRMAPSIRMPVDHVPRDPVDAGVLILLYPSGQTICTVFIKRADYQGIHSGQISFPGGKSEPADKNIIQTAIREAEEELGIDLQQIHFTGTLTQLYIPISNTSVFPVIGYIENIPSFHPDSKEVDYVIEVVIDELLKPGNVKCSDMEIRSENIRVPYYDISGEQIWGATAMILSEFIEIINRCRRTDQE